MLNLKPILAGALASVALVTQAATVEMAFTVEDTSAMAGDHIVQVGMYAQHSNGTTASAIWDNVKIVNASNTIVFEDNFNDRSLTDATIGNNWTWYDTSFSDASCSTYVSGYGPYSDNDGSDYVHANNNYTRLGDNGTYFRAGLQGADGAASLEVYHNQFATQTCNEIKVFQEITNLADGDYRLSVSVSGNEYTPIASGNQVGLFFKVLDVANGYSEAQFSKQTVDPAAAASGPAVTNAGDPNAIPFMPGALLGFFAVALCVIGLRSKVR